MIFIKISLPLERIVGSTFKKKWQMKTMVLSESIIGSHYKELRIIYFNFTLLKNKLHLDKVSIRNTFVFHVLGRSQLFLPVMHR